MEPSFAAAQLNRVAKKLSGSPALTYAVNKEAIIKAVYQGAGQAAKNLIPPTMWGYNDDVKDYTYDPEKAKQPHS